MGDPARDHRTLILVAPATAFATDRSRRAIVFDAAQRLFACVRGSHEQAALRPLGGVGRQRLCLSVASAGAQTGTATLQGVVVDEQKAAVPGATVTLTNTDTGTSRVTTTADNGSYQFTGAPSRCDL